MVTIGAYDGVHLGHRRVIETVRVLALDEGLDSVVVTFDRHPAAVVRPESAPKLLTDLEQKLELLTSLGVDEVELIHFDEERSAETAEQFVDEVLVAELRARIVVVGRDFHFGKGRGGNVALLEEMGRSRGFSVVPFDLVDDETRHEVVSSTRIRALVARGCLDEAAALLARPYEVRGIAGPREPSGSQPVFVAGELLLPPPGAYRASAGPVGGEAPAGVRVELPEPSDPARSDGERQLDVVDGLEHPLPAGGRVRVLFAGREPRST